MQRGKGFNAPNGRKYVSVEAYIRELKQAQYRLLNGKPEYPIDAKPQRTIFGVPVNTNAFAVRTGRTIRKGKKVFDLA